MAASSINSRRLALALFVAWIAAFFAPSASADVVSISVDPQSVYGTDNSNGTVTVDFRGFPSPTTVSLFSSNANVASVPSSVSTGFRDPDTAHFVVTTYPVAVATNVIITAQHSGVSRQAVLTVRPPILTSIVFDPNPLRGSDSSVATITINRPAPANWYCNIQGSFPPIYFATGSIVSFTPGAMATNKTVNSQAALIPTDALITVRPPTGQSPTISATLTVLPTQVASMTLTPLSITGGAGSLGCVTLNGKALEGGAAVQLSSDDPSIAGVPPTLQIAQGDDDGCFLVQSHAVADCTSVVISASFGGATVEATLDVGVTDQITDNAENDRWNSRHASTVDGKVLWHNDNDVYLDDGTTTQLVQARGDLDMLSDEAFGLGSGGNEDEVIGAWRRGEDFAWVWRSGHAPVLVSAVNPIDPKEPMNPEAIGIADGSVFMAFQAFFDANSVKHVFRVDPITGVATNLTGDSAAPGVSRVTTDRGQAAWLFVDSANPKLHFYDDSGITVVDSGEINGFNLRLVRGRLVYEKVDEGVSHVFLFDSTTADPSPVRISPDTDAAHGHFSPATDGYHVAWLFGDANHTNLDVLLYGGLQLNDATSRPVAPPGVDFPLQLQRGQLIWKDAQSNLRYVSGGVIETPCLTPADSFTSPWLADGFIAGFGPVQDSPDPDNEVFLYPGIAPDDADKPLPPLLVRSTPSDGGVFLEWDRVLGASSYNVYLAEQPGVTKDNYLSLPGGRRIAGITSNSTRVCGLSTGVTYFFVVTVTEGADEGGNSTEFAGAPNPDWLPGETDVFAVLGCLSGPGATTPPLGCSEAAASAADFTCDGDVDLEDVAVLSNLIE